VGIIREGRLVATQRVSDLMVQPFKRLQMRFAEQPPDGTFDRDGVTVLSRDDQSITLEVRDGLPEVMETAARFGIADIETQHVSLEEVFLAYYGQGNGENNA